MSSAHRGGPAARNAINPPALVSFIDAWSELVYGGYPKRWRLTINGTPISVNDARMVRRWRQGNIKGVTTPSAAALLDRYGLTFAMFTEYCEQKFLRPTLRGKLPKENV
jgi:hypothetical protein